MMCILRSASGGLLAGEPFLLDRFPANVKTGGTRSHVPEFLRGGPQTGL